MPKLVPAPTETAPTSDTVLAAGGILVNSDGKVALVRRPKYDDTCLPKGKVDVGESPLDAALREVREETGFDAEPVGFAGTVSYRANGRPKIVLFWRMRAKARSGDPDAGEIDRVEWVTPTDAVARLDHAEERDLVQTQFQLRPRAVQHAGRAPWLRFSRRVRLHAHLLARRPELEATLSAWQDANGGASPAWIAACRQLLALAERAQAKGHIEEAWRCLSGVLQMEAFAFSRDRLDSEAAALRQEAKEKIPAWRGAAVKDLLEEETWAKLSDHDCCERLARSMQIRDDNTANMYHKAALLKEQLAAVGTVLLALVALLLWRSSSDPIPLSGTMASSGMLLWYAALFGALAGCLSAAWSLARSDSKERIPERLMNWPATLARPLLGAAAGASAYVVLGPGLEASATAVLAAAFTAGFSERFILSAVGTEKAKQDN